MPGIIIDRSGEAGFEFRPKMRMWQLGPLGLQTRGADVEFRLWVTLTASLTGEVIATADVFDFEISNGDLARSTIRGDVERQAA